MTSNCSEIFKNVNVKERKGEGGGKSHARFLAKSFDPATVPKLQPHLISSHLYFLSNLILTSNSPPAYPFI